MARSRNIKPGFFKNEVLASLDARTRLLFIGLWTYADKAGRFEIRLEKIKVDVFPHEQVMLEPCMAQLWDKHFLTFFEAGGKHYAQINNWAKHQSPHHKEVESEIPAPTEEKVFENEADIHAWLMHGSCMNQSRLKQIASSPLIPDSLNLIPDSLIPDSRSLIPSTPAAAGSGQAAPKPARAKGESKTAACWKAYEDAYCDRYGVSPTRNAKVNGQMARVVDRLGAEEAPLVAGFFVHHNANWYVTKGHAVDCLLADAEKLRTEWATGRQITQTTARNMDKTASNPFAKMLNEQRS